MKRVIHFSKAFIPAYILSGALIVFGIVGYLLFGFNLGVDFQAGVNQTIQVANPAFELSYSGKGTVQISAKDDSLSLVFSGAEVEAHTLVVDYGKAKTIGDVVAAIKTEKDVTVTEKEGAAALPSTSLVPTYQGNTNLGTKPVLVHREAASAAERDASTEKVRKALEGLSYGEASVQVVGQPALQRFLIRVQDDGKDPAFAKTAAANIVGGLEKSFGAGRIVTVQTDYVGARYSKSLGQQSAFLILMTSVVIMIYAGFRFKLQYGIGAVLAILHDALIMVGFVVWTRMEFNTSTIAAILTILGYSINDTIVQFDRVREDRRLRPTEKFVHVLDRALTETLGRTIITTLSTMITVIALFAFTSGSIKDFALALFVGMVSGTYSTIYIASGFVVAWEDAAEKRQAKARNAAPAAASPAK